MSTMKKDGFSQVKTNQNARLFPVTTESEFGLSTTIPDQSMSIKEILDRFARGLPLDGYRVPVWDGEEDLPDFNRMDLADIENYMRNNQEEIQYLQAEQKQLAEMALKRTETAQKPAEQSAEG